jgi:3-hydroxybutyryl-CoA dehydrogenase
MVIAVVANEETKQDWLKQGVQSGANVVWLDNPAPVANASIYIDLLFDLVENRVQEWQHTPSPILINNVVKCTPLLPENFIRFNGWPVFLQSPIMEAAAVETHLQETATLALAAFNKQVDWVADISGFIAARVVAMIINEAYYTLEEGISGKAEIDTAMKLGTNYPYGPFEWSQKIGLKNICALLESLAKDQPRYTPSALLKKEALL